MKPVINIIGYPACGKSSVCTYLVSQGFELFRPSDVLRAYAKEQNFELTKRQDYVDLHRALNQERPYAIVEPVIAAAADTKNPSAGICVDGLRSPLLLDKLQAELPTVITIALDCPIEERYRRVERDDERKGTHRAPVSLKAFKADELPDYQNPDRNLPNMEEMISRADYHIDAAQSPELIASELSRIINISK